MRSLFGIFLGLSLSSTLLLAGCNQTNTPDNQEVLKLLYWQAPTILNPHLSTGFKDSEASRITLEPLASYNAQGQLIPFLAAEIPNLAPDGKSVTWKLKQGLKWSDGQPFTAADVVFTYAFIPNPKTGSTSASNYASVKQVTAEDDYTVKVVFKGVNPAWTSVFVGTEGMILPRHLYQDFQGEKARSAPANLQPVGTGPYQVLEFKPGDAVIYTPNSHFREPNLAFKRVEIKGGGDATAAARSVLQSQEADYAYNLQVESQVLQELQASGKGKLIAEFGSLVERVLFNLSDPNYTTKEGERANKNHPHPFLSEPKIRQAFALAIDRDTIAKQLYGITGKPTANVLVLPQQYYSQNTRYEFDLEQAQKLLDEAGWQDSNGNGTRDKNGVEMQIIFQTSVNPLRQKTQEIIKQGLQAIGVGVELKSVDPSVFFASDPSNNDTLEKFYADLQMFTTGNGIPDPETYFQTYTCDTIPQKANNWSGDNYSRYCNPKYDQLFFASRRELNPVKRQEIFKQMNDLLIKDFVVVPLVHRADVVAISDRLEGFELTPWDRNTWKIKDWKFKK